MTAGRLLLRGPEPAGPAGLSRRERATVGRALAATMAATLACGGITLLGRRLGGGFTVTPGPALAWTVTAAGWGLLAATDLGTRIGGGRWAGWLARTGLAAAALAVAPLGGSLSWAARLAAASAVAAALVAAVMPAPTARPIGSRAKGRWRPRGTVAAGDQSVAGSRESVAGIAPTLPAAGGEPADSPPVDHGALGAMTAGLRQRLERFETATGDDHLRGRLLVPVAAGSRSGHAHIGFCPPFAGTPLVDASADSDLVEAEITAAEILPWGVRIECRLAEPAEEAFEIPVGLLARHPR
jgi:hypothetical protein